MTMENGNGNGLNRRTEALVQSTLLTLAARASSILATALIGMVAWLAVGWIDDVKEMSIVLSRTTAIQETLQRSDTRQDESIGDLWREIRSMP